MTHFLVMALALVALAERVRAVCSASEMVATEPSCAAPVCRIRGTYTIEDQCVLDFSFADVVLEAGARWNLGSRSATVLARSFTMRAGAFVDARGLATQGPGARGGTVELRVGGPVLLEAGSTRGRIDASATQHAGQIRISAAGPLRIAGRLLAANLTSGGSGGRIELVSSDAVIIESSAEMDFSGGLSSPGGGGSLSIRAGADVTLGAPLAGNGSNGGTVQIEAGGKVAVGTVLLSGTGDAGSGGTLAIRAFRDVALLGPVRLQGSTRLLTDGGDGGALSIESRYGSVQVGATLSAEGAEPNGFGGSIQIVAAGSLTFAKGTTVSVRANGSLGAGGTLQAWAGQQIVQLSAVDASGGAEGGQVGLEALGDLVLAGTMDVRGRGEGAVGGEAGLLTGGSTEGLWAQGDLRISGTVDVSGGVCGTSGCGAGGSFSATGCSVSLEGTSRVLARGGGEGGVLIMTARSSLGVQGTLLATPSTSGGRPGVIHFQLLNGITPVVSGNALPLPVITASPPCTSETIAGCVMPCPRCGDGRTDYPEECDDGNQASCDGCSAHCQQEDCAPAAWCVPCEASLGCPPEPEPPCASPPSATPTPTARPSATSTPTARYSATATRAVPAATLTATETPRVVPTASPTPTPHVSGSVTTLPTRSPTRTWSPTAGLQPSPTLPPTATASPTSTPRSRHDLILFPPRPVVLRLGPGAALVRKRLPVRVRNIASDSGVPVPVRVVAASNCPTGSVPEAVAFDPGGEGNPRVALVPPGNSRQGLLEIEARAEAFTSTGPLSPQRCRIELVAEVALPGNQDPTPDNNRAFVEVDVVDAGDGWLSKVHQTAIVAARPKVIRLQPGHDFAEARLRLGLRNGDRNDRDGHSVRLVGSDGTCPAGTIAPPLLRPRPDLLPGSVWVRSAGTRGLSVPVRYRRADIPLATPGRRYRCFLSFEAIGPAGDRDPSNNTTVLTLDMVVR